MGHMTISNRKIEIKRPCHKDVISLLNLLAQDTQTAMVICTAKEWDASGVEEEKTFTNYHCTLERKTGILVLLILELHSKLFCRANLLSKKDQNSKGLLFIYS